jgi:hypothetical protein
VFAKKMLKTTEQSNKAASPPLEEEGGQFGFVLNFKLIDYCYIRMLLFSYIRLS